MDLAYRPVIAVAALLVVTCIGVTPAGAAGFVFEENRGQAGSNVHFLARRGRTAVAIEKNAFVISEDGPDGRLKYQRTSFDASNPDAVIRSEQRLRGTVNYLIGNDPALWLTDVPTWEQVRIEDVYPGIDVLFRANGDGLTYDFVVDEDADADMLTRREGNIAALAMNPAVVFSTYLGGSSGDEATAVAADAAGNVYITGETYSTNFPFLGGVQSTNKSAPGERDIFITKLDPSGSVIFSTYFGGSAGREVPEAIAVDASGAVYVTGTTYSEDLPISSNAFQKEINIWVGDDGFLTKLSPAGNSIEYSTFLSAESNGPSTETIRGLAVDAAGNAVVAGDTTDPSWPVTAGAYRTTGCGDGLDAFVTKLNTDGSALVYSTYLCGNDFDTGNDVVLDASGNAYVTGATSSIDFPQTGDQTAPKETDMWLAKLDVSGSILLHSRLLGGSSGDVSRAIAIDAKGDVYVGGRTLSIDFPSVGGFQTSYGGGRGCQRGICGDGFLARFSSGFDLLSATFLGGARSDDDVTSLAITPAGVLATGRTESTDFPLFSPIQSTIGGTIDTFITSFDPTLRNITFSTFFGGNDWDVGAAIAVDDAGAIHLTGFTGSTNFPVTNAHQPANAGEFDAFVVKLSGFPTPVPRRRSMRR